MIPEAAAPQASRSPSLPGWVVALGPLVLLAALVVLIVWTAPADRLRAPGTPPVERLAIERATLHDDGIVLGVMNDGPDPVTIAQVTVDDAFWAFTMEGGATLGHLGRTSVSIPYPWVAGEAHLVKLLTSTGTAFEHAIPVALATPRAQASNLALFTLIGIYVGVLPVALGLLWFPLMSRLGRTGLDALLALTVGLLVFLLIDAIQEGLEAAGAMPGAYQGVALMLACAAAAYLGLETFGAWLKARRARVSGAGDAGAVLALLVAVGIGLHNFGEGLAIGAAFALGEAALGTLLIVGFTLHNTTEGLAIVAPIAKSRPSWRTLAGLGLIGGVPTIVGAWFGGLVYSPVLAVACLGLGAGAIAQVTGQITKQIGHGNPAVSRLASAPILMGLLAGFGLMYLTGMLVG